MQTPVTVPIAVGTLLVLVIGGLSVMAHHHTLNGIRSKTVGHGQHGTARWASKSEVRRTFARVPFTPKLWREGKNLPAAQGIILGCVGAKGALSALVDEGDVHAMMVAASGAGKTAYFLYPNMEYACACGMSFLCTDTKGDLFRNCANIAKERYGYNVAVIDLRNPTRSDGFNLLHLVNKYMDVWAAAPGNLAAKAKAEKYAKIISKTIVNASGDSARYGQNAFFYDAAEGLLTSSVSLWPNTFLPKKMKPTGGTSSVYSNWCRI
jgi:type IV secretion system protein VirD4